MIGERCRVVWVCPTCGRASVESWHSDRVIARGCGVSFYCSDGCGDEHHNVTLKKRADGAWVWVTLPYIASPAPRGDA